MDLAVTVTNAGRVIEIFERQMAVASTILEFKIPPQTTPRFGFQARIGQNLANAAALPLILLPSGRNAAKSRVCLILPAMKTSAER